MMLFIGQEVFGANDYKVYPLAKHHFKVMRNKKGFCRLIYNCRHQKISFLKNKKSL